MKEAFYSPTQQSPSHSPTKSTVAPRKASFLRVPSSRAKHLNIQLPRFYSSEDKKPKKSTLLKQKKQELNPFQDENPAKGRSSMIKKHAIPKYSKTEKNETPTKHGQSSHKTIKVSTPDKWNELIQKSMQSRKELGLKGKLRKRRETIDELEGIQTQLLQGAALDKQGSCSQKNQKKDSQSNLNRIRYKCTQHRREKSYQCTKNMKVIETQLLQPEPLARSNKTAREHKTQQSSDQQSTLCRSLAKNQDLFKDYLRTNHSLQQRQRKHSQQSSSQQTGHSKLTPADHNYLTFVVDILHKTLKHYNNLDFPEAFIVAEKNTFERAIHGMLSERYQRHFKVHIIYLRIAYYLTAHLILSSSTPKSVFGVFNKLLQSQLIIQAILGQGAPHKVQKHSQPRTTIDESSRRELGLAVESRGNRIATNNQKIKKLFEGIFGKANKMTYCQLFQSLLISSEKIDSFEFIAFLDKTLKWQVLKMPSFPFLPPCLTSQAHHLILDLDETLIHYNMDRQIFHIRPHAEQFLKHLSAFFEISIFTAGTKEYADEIIDDIDKGGSIKHRLYRNHLTFLGEESVKDLSMLGRSLKATLMIDNLQSNFRMHPANGILVKSWYHDPNDQVLLKLQTLLIKIATEFKEDLREGVHTYQAYIDRQISESRAPAVKIDYKL